MIVTLIFYCLFISILENKKADNLGRLSAVILSQNFSAHSFSFYGETFFESELNFHLFSFCKNSNFKLILQFYFSRIISIAEIFLTFSFNSLSFSSLEIF